MTRCPTNQRCTAKCEPTTPVREGRLHTSRKMRGYGDLRRRLIALLVGHRGMSSLAVPSLAVPGAVPRGSRTRRSSSVPAPRLATDKRGASVLPSASAGKSPRRPRRDQFLLALVFIRAARSNRSREPLPLRSGPFPRAHRRSPTSRPNSNEQTMTEVRPPRAPPRRRRRRTGSSPAGPTSSSAPRRPRRGRSSSTTSRRCTTSSTTSYPSAFIACGSARR